MIGLEAREMYYKHFHNADKSEAVIIDNIIYGDDINWNMLAELITYSTKRQVVYIVGNIEKYSADIDEIAKMIEKLGGHICITPYDWGPINIAMNATIEKLRVAEKNNVDLGYIANEINSQNIVTLNTICSIDEMLIEKADVVIIVNTDSDNVEDEKELVEQIRTIATKQNSVKRICYLINKKGENDE